MLLKEWGRIREEIDILLSCVVAPSNLFIQVGKKERKAASISTILSWTCHWQQLVLGKFGRWTKSRKWNLILSKLPRPGKFYKTGDIHTTKKRYRHKKKCRAKEGCRRSRKEGGLNLSALLLLLYLCLHTGGFQLNSDWWVSSMNNEAGFLPTTTTTMMRMGPAEVKNEPNKN